MPQAFGYTNTTITHFKRVVTSVDYGKHTVYFQMFLFFNFYLTMNIIFFQRYCIKFILISIENNNMALVFSGLCNQCKHCCMEKD